MSEKMTQPLDLTGQEARESNLMMEEEEKEAEEDQILLLTRIEGEAVQSQDLKMRVVRKICQEEEDERGLKGMKILEADMDRVLR